MALDVYFKDDIHAIILAGLTLELRTALANGANDLAGALGVLRLAEHNARALKIRWHGTGGLLDEARTALSGDGIDVARLFDDHRAGAAKQIVSRDAGPEGTDQ